MKFPSSIFLAMVLGGCALFEPTAITHFNAKPGIPTENIFSCIESTIQSLKTKRILWRNDVTARDIVSGLFETGNFSEWNIMGIRVQIRYNSFTGDGRIKIKASGIYLKDLGADLAAEQLANGVTQCLASA
jgi:hypothetical protein